MHLSKTILTQILSYLDIESLYNFSFLSIVDDNFWHQWLHNNFFINDYFVKGDQYLFRQIYERKFCIVCLKKRTTSPGFCCNTCLNSINLEYSQFQKCNIS